MGMRQSPTVSLPLALTAAIAFAGLAQAETVATGRSHTLIVTDKAVVYAFGDNSRGQAGQDRTLKTVTLPTQVPELTGIVAVAAGAEHSLALDARGRVFAYGSNQYGQLGIQGAYEQAIESTSIPVPVTGLSDVVAIAAGDFHSVALTRGGTVYVWGLGDEGQLDNGSICCARQLLREPVNARLRGPENT